MKLSQLENSIKKIFHQQVPVNDFLLSASLAAGILLAYLFYLEQDGINFFFYLYNFYLKDWPLHLDLIIPILIWTTTILASLALFFLPRFHILIFLLLAGCVSYLKSFSTFAQCSWGDTLPPIFLLLALNSWVAPRGKMSLLILRGLELILALIYFTSATHRLLDPYWMRGEITQLLLESRTFSRWTEIDWTAWKKVLVVSSYAVFTTEFIAGFLPFLGRTRKFVILLLIPIHILIGISSTEMVWQLFVIALLSLSYQQNVTRLQISSLQKLVAAIIVLLLYLAALPFNSPFTIINTIVASSRHAVEITGLLPLTQRRVFHTKPSYGTCFFIYAESENHFEKIGESDAKECLTGKNYFFQNNFLHATVRATLDIYGPTVKNNHFNKNQIQQEMLFIQEDISNRWGYAACKKFSTVSKSMDKVFIFTINIFRDRNFKLSPLVLSHFSCQQNRTLELGHLGTSHTDIIKQEIRDLKLLLPPGSSLERF